MKFLFENWREYLNEEEQRVVTFDFDSTLALSHWDEEEDDWAHDGPHKQMIDRIRSFLQDSSIAVYVVTSRFEKNEPNALEGPGQKSVREFLEEQGLDVEGVFFTNGQPKIETLLKLRSSLHHDDDPGDILDAEDRGIETVVSDPYGDYSQLERSEIEKREKKNV
jgi:hypothetical protein